MKPRTFGTARLNEVAQRVRSALLGEQRTFAGVQVWVKASERSPKVQSGHRIMRGIQFIPPAEIKFYRRHLVEWLTIRAYKNFRIEVAVQHEKIAVFALLYSTLRGCDTEVIDGLDVFRHVEMRLSHNADRAREFSRF